MARALACLDLPTPTRLSFGGTAVFYELVMPALSARVPLVLSLYSLGLRVAAVLHLFPLRTICPQTILGGQAVVVDLCHETLVMLPDVTPGEVSDSRVPE